MADAQPAYKPSSPLRDAVRIFTRNRPALISFILIACMTVAAITGVLFTGRKPDVKTTVRLEEAGALGDRVKIDVNPNAVLDPVSTKLPNTFLEPFQDSRDPEAKEKYWLGSDHLGRDVLARLWAGSSISLTIGFLAVGISVLLGITLGGIAGYFGRDRVGLPMLLTLLSALAAAVAYAAEFTGLAVVLFGVCGGLFTCQVLIAFLGNRRKVALFFVVTALLFAAVVAYDTQIEASTPEGEVAQAAGRVYQDARGLLLEVRDYGFRIKEFENTPEGSLIAPKDGTKRPQPPAWRIAGQVSLEAKARMVDLDVLLYEFAGYRSRQRIALRLAEEQIARGAYLDGRRDAYKEKFDDANSQLAALQPLLTQAQNSRADDEARRLRKEQSIQDNRRSTFDPDALALKAEEDYRRTGIIEQARATKMIEATVKAIDEYRAALDKGFVALKAVLANPAATEADLRLRGYEIESAMRDVKAAQGAFFVADAQAQVDAANAAVDAAKKYSETVQDEKFKPGAAKAVEALQADVAKKTKAAVGKRTDLEARQAAVKDLAEHVEKAKAALIKVEAERDADLAGLDKTVPTLALQGSYELIERRGEFRKTVVQKFEADSKNKLQAVLNAETLGGHYRYGLYRILRHFLTFVVLGLLLVISGLAVMAAAQGAVVDRLKAMRPFFLPTITVDDLVMRFTEVMMTIPVLFLILAVLALFDKDVFITMAVIGLTSWMGTTRFVRAEILSLREQDFIQAARSLGVSDFRIIWRHLVPNAISPVLVSATLGVAGAVLAESTLSFLGIGAGPTQSTWGQVLSEGREYINDAWWLTVIPGVAILITVLSFNLLGEGLREAFNPKLRGR